MTREEEILNAARKYNNGITLSNPSNVLHFEAGAKWADEHSINVWHDASEIPDKQGNLLYILSQGSLHISNIPSALRTCKLDKVRWEEYAKELGVVKWAYVSDLLPKGGDE